MYRVPEFYKTVSQHLSDVLDDIGINEITIQRRRTLTLKANTYKWFGNDFSMYVFGSSADGTNLLDLCSDQEVKLSDNHINIVQSMTELDSDKVNILMIYENEDPSGYCRLQALSPLQSLTRKDMPYLLRDNIAPNTFQEYTCAHVNERYSLPLHAYGNDDHGRVYKEDILHCTTQALEKFGKIGPTDIYGDDDKGRVFIENEWFQVQSTKRLEEEHGPAKRDKQKDTELILAFHYSKLPIPRRSVTYNNKNNSNFDYSECFLEPVGHILSENESVQWRIDVSPAEQQMMHSNNITQTRCYILLKLIVNTYIGSSIEGAVSSYMCKTVLMHTIDRTHYELWTENNLLLCLKMCLHLLKMSVLMNNLPNYFMPEVNLFEGKCNIISQTEIVHQILLLTDDAVESVLEIGIGRLGGRLLSKFSQIIQFVTPEKATDVKQTFHLLKPAVDIKSKTGKEKDQTVQCLKTKDIEQFRSAGTEAGSLLLKECERICAFIKNKSDRILHVWPACDTSEEGKLVFVVVATEDLKVDVDYRTYVRIVDHYSEEGKCVMQSRENAENRLSACQSEKIRNVIDRYADTLMQNHRYISVITGSGVRSVGFATENEEIIPEACVVVYVVIKGKIPLEEEEIPKTLDGIPVDIREGGFQTSVLTAFDYHTNVRMGCQITSSAKPDIYGTLGGFIEHPEYGLCGITCAHVLLNEHCMHDLRGRTKSVENEGFVYQPNTVHQNNTVGPIREVAYKAGGDGLPGIDLAVFQIDTRPPECGNFPGTSGGETNLLYESGKIAGEKQFNLNDKHVVKFGRTSGLTEGFVEFYGTAVKKIDFDREYEARTNRYTYTLLNQLEIRPSNNGRPFNEGGDSGALVFKKDVTGSLICIGMVVGAYSSGNGIVTPISAIKRELGVLQLKNFTENKIDRLERRMQTMEDRLERRMQTMEQYMQKIASKLGVD